MKNTILILIILSFIFSIGCSTSTSKEELPITKDTTDTFIQFCGNFKNLNLPFEFNISTLYLRDEITHFNEIDSELVETYIADIANFWKYSTADKKLCYNYIGQFKEAKNYYALIYNVIDFNTCCKATPIANDSKLILATYSKQNFKRISKVVLFAYNDCNYLINSVVSKDFKIKIDFFYHLSMCNPMKIENNFYLPSKKYPQCFVIKHYSANFTILPSGKIVQENESKMKQYVAKYNEESYEYPIIIPEIDSLYDEDHSLKKTIK